MRQHESKIADLKRTLRSHPCHACSEREAHARWGERYQKLRKKIDGAVAQIESRTNQVSKIFTRICDLLQDLDYMQPDGDDLEITESGQRLAKIYGERDLLIAQCVNQGTWKDLDPASLAAMAAALVYENRRDDGDYEPKLPKGNFRDALDATEAIQLELAELQDKYQLPEETPLDLGLSYSIYRWATGARLDDVLKSSGLLAGDFIRWSKQIIDLLDQLAQGADPVVAETAYKAMDQVKRGIVAYSYYM
jgi:ATP-dependent RNA helicase HelY